MKNIEIPDTISKYIVTYTIYISYIVLANI